jgi:hypothetical protein
LPPPPPPAITKYSNVTPAPTTFNVPDEVNVWTVYNPEVVVVPPDAVPGTFDISFQLDPLKFLTTLSVVL